MELGGGQFSPIPIYDDGNTYSVFSAQLYVMFSVIFYRKPSLEVEVDASAQDPAPRLPYFIDLHILEMCKLPPACIF